MTRLSDEERPLTADPLSPEEEATLRRQAAHPEMWKLADTPRNPTVLRLLATIAALRSQPIQEPRPDLRDVIYRTFVATLTPTGTLGRARTRRPAVGLVEAYEHLRRVIDELPRPAAQADGGEPPLRAVVLNGLLDASACRACGHFVTQPWADGEHALDCWAAPVLVRAAQADTAPGGLREAVLAAGPPPDALMDDSPAGQALRSWWLDRYAPALRIALDAERARLITDGVKPVALAQADAAPGGGE